MALCTLLTQTLVGNVKPMLSSMAPTTMTNVLQLQSYRTQVQIMLLYFKLDLYHTFNRIFNLTFVFPCLPSLRMDSLRFISPDDRKQHIHSVG